LNEAAPLAQEAGDSLMQTCSDRREFLRSIGKTAALGTLGALAPAKSLFSATDKPYLSAAQTFLDTIIEKGTDRYGKKQTPVFCLALDPETHAPPKPPVKIDWHYARSFEFLYRDFGYYWKSHLHGSGLIYDQGTIRALYVLTSATGKPEYAKAADAYLNFFLENMVSQQTGMFGWGEHIFYNVFLDYIIGGGFTVRGSRNFLFAHELERWTTIYDLMWDKSPEKTLAEIEAIYEYKIIDYETFTNNRHSDYYAGRRTGDVLTFVKHSGLFAHAFAFLHSKTSESKYLQWARKMADLFWNQRDAQTGLVRSSIERKDEPPAAGEMALASLFLLRAYQWHPDSVFAERAVAYVKAYHKHFQADGDGRFRESVDGGGKDLKPGQYAEYWEAPIRQAKAAVLAYSLTKDSTALELADKVIMRLTPEMGFNTIIIRSLISDEVEARSCALSTAIDLYEVTGERKYLDKALALADDAIRRFLYRGLFVSSMQLHPEGDKSLRVRVYDARSGAGWLASNLIRLQRDLDATQAGRFKKFDKLERIYD
jgi:N-acylglucosamine 2-epimerase (GlcNAc 2-epimerase)